jgi:NAD(P)-dependent dehydrogenase (short-subunit alcohol dehydrogenase family)
MTAFQLENAVAFVTGTSKKNGMGRAIVDALVASGVAKIYATARKVDQIYM